MLFCMQQIFIALCLQLESVDNAAIFILIVLCFAGIIVSIIGLIIRPKSLKAYRRQLFHRSYGDRTFLLVLGTMIAMNVFLLISINVSKFVFYVEPIFPLAVIIYTIFRRPFKLVWNNIRLVIVEACLLACLILVIVMLNNEDDIDSRSTFYLPMWMLGFMCLALLVTIITWAIMLR